MVVHRLGVKVAIAPQLYQPTAVSLVLGPSNLELYLPSPCSTHDAGSSHLQGGMVFPLFRQGLEGISVEHPQTELVPKTTRRS